MSRILNDLDFIKRAQEDSEVMNDFISCNDCIKFIKFIIKKYIHLNETYYDYEELISLGYIGIFKALRNFDCSKNVKFSTYASTKILGEIKRYFRDYTLGGGPIHFKVTRSVKETYQSILDYCRKKSMIVKEFDDNHAEILKKEKKISEKVMNEAMSLINTTVLSVNFIISESDNSNEKLIVEKHLIVNDDNFDFIDIKLLIIKSFNKYIKTVKNRETREFMKEVFYYMINEYSQREICDIVNKSQAYVSKYQIMIRNGIKKYFYEFKKVC